MKALRFVGFIFIAFVVLINLLSKRITEVTIEETTRDTIASCQETEYFIQNARFHRRAWKDNIQRWHCLEYDIKNSVNQEARGRRYYYNKYSAKTYLDFWGNLYAYIAKGDKPYLHPLIDSIKQLNANQQYNRDQYADVIVSMIQDIDYAYILSSQKCKDQSGNRKLCLENEKFGLLSPIEFMYSLRGDCDTRSLLLYIVLKEFGYHPKIAVSMAYEHAMLLVDVSGPGKFLRHLGKKYYFWETTSKGWRAGYIPPKTADVSEWEIALH